MITISWKGKHISLNDWYAGKHWTYRQKQKNLWRTTFTDLLSQHKKPNIEKYSIELEYNSRLDPSNTITMIKLFEDTLIKLGWIKDDSKKYCKYLKIYPNNQFSSKEYKLHLSYDDV